MEGRAVKNGAMTYRSSPSRK